MITGEKTDRLHFGKRNLSECRFFILNFICHIIYRNKAGMPAQKIKPVLG